MDRHHLCVEQDMALFALDKDAVLMLEVHMKVSYTEMLLVTVPALPLLVKISIKGFPEDFAPCDFREVFRPLCRHAKRNRALVDSLLMFGHRNS